MNINRIILSLVFFAASTTTAEVARIEVERSRELANGKTYGLAGAYESVAGKIHYTGDPQTSVNGIISDIESAPTNASGLVEFSADFYLIKPKNIESGNGAVFF